jgi:hypothetical protein
VSDQYPNKWKRLQVFNELPFDIKRLGLSFNDYTCAECPESEKGCQSAFDPYNTSGDCLEEK